MGGSVHCYKNTELLVVVNKKIGLAVNVDKNKYMVMSGDQNAGQNHNIKSDKNYLKKWSSKNIWDQT